MESESYSRPCPCCEGAGCDECDSTGQRVVTIIDFDGGTMRVNGCVELSEKDRGALAELGKAVHDLSG